MMIVMQGRVDLIVTTYDPWETACDHTYDPWEGPILCCDHNITLDALFKHHHMNHMGTF